MEMLTVEERVAFFLVSLGCGGAAVGLRREGRALLESLLEELS